jgi:putative NADH-flavin reductase
MNNLTTTTRSKILVLGATGGTGRLIVSQALERRHEVTVLVRSPEKANGLTGAKLIVGDVRDEKVLREALKGQNAVVSAIGTPASPFSEVTLLSTATRALVGAMKAEHVSRLVCITGMGAGDSVGHGGFLFDNVIFPFLLKNVYADKNRQETIVRDSGLDWILVRPTVLHDKPGRVGPGLGGSFRLPWRGHIASRRCGVRLGSSGRRCLAASFTVDHLVTTVAASRGSKWNAYQFEREPPFMAWSMVPMDRSITLPR